MAMSASPGDGLPIPFVPAASPTLPFTSSFGAFNLPAPRISHASPAQAMQVDADVFVPPQPHFLASGHPSFPSSGLGTFAASSRRPSMLTQELLRTSPSPPSDPSELSMPQSPSRSRSSSPMILGSPPFEPTPMPMYRHPLLQAHAHVRSRSTSSGSVPASPVTVARALGRHTTPPPFLQRKLFNGMNEDEGSGSTSSGSDRGGTRDLTVMEEYEAEDEMAGVGLGLRSSGSAEEGRGVIRRAVSRKPNLLPKPKSHLRVLSQLRTEDGPADQLEIASEATLHRISRSGAASIPSFRSTPIPSIPSDHRPPSSNGLGTSRPTPNRFPEQANEEEEYKRAGSASSSDGEEGGEAGSDWGGMSMGYATEDEEERKANIWTGIRGTSGIGGGIVAGSASGKSPHSERGRMEMETQQNSPSTVGFYAYQSGRPGKRKNADDRFEPYAQAFKRRAVSPAPNPPLASPTLAFASMSSFPTPPPLPLPFSLPTSTSFPSPISIPSPRLESHHSFFYSLSGSRSRGGSPSGSMGSSAGRSSGFLGIGTKEFGMAMSGRAASDDSKGSKMGEADLGRMSLG